MWMDLIVITLCTTTSPLYNRISPSVCRSDFDVSLLSPLSLWFLSVISLSLLPLFLFLLSLSLSLYVLYFRVDVPVCPSIPKLFVPPIHLWLGYSLRGVLGDLINPLPKQRSFTFFSSSFFYDRKKIHWWWDEKCIGRAGKPHPNLLFYCVSFCITPGTVDYLALYLSTFPSVCLDGIVKSSFHRRGKIEFGGPSTENPKLSRFPNSTIKQSSLSISPLFLLRKSVPNWNVTGYGNNRRLFTD